MDRVLVESQGERRRHPAVPRFQIASAEREHGILEMRSFFRNDREVVTEVCLWIELVELYSLAFGPAAGSAREEHTQFDTSSVHAFHKRYSCAG